IFCGSITSRSTTYLGPSTNLRPRAAPQERPSGLYPRVPFARISPLPYTHQPRFNSKGTSSTTPSLTTLPSLRPFLSPQRPYAPRSGATQHSLAPDGCGPFLRRKGGGRRAKADRWGAGGRGAAAEPCAPSRPRGFRDALDALGLKRYCCRRMLLAHVDLIEKLLNYAPLEK
ncbi:DNA-directed RNA polymerases I, II, and III subunit RPABC5, partial [Ailuropoda melanoleuca]|uniref:DNA-directed RNA polymerases I, II, and III subunit RPABC5 n=1 Tax=Ailuropoda melanoleuca TaxID=9646 RepID=UPI0014944ED7